MHVYIPLQFKQPYSQEEMDAVAYTGRQLNSTSAAVQLFNMVIICKLVQVQMVVTSMQKCFDLVEVAYWYNKAEKYGRYTILTLKHAQNLLYMKP